MSLRLGKKLQFINGNTLLDHIKIKNVCSSKDTIKRVERQDISSTYFQDFQFITGPQQFHYHVPSCSLLYAYLVWSSLNFLDIKVYPATKLERLFNHYFFKVFFCILFPLGFYIHVS